MFLTLILVFVVGYASIALEHPLMINKSASALFLAVLMWILLMAGGSTLLPHIPHPQLFLKDELLRHLGEIAEILFFLVGAMTIVELIDSHEGFRIITDRITTRNKVKLLWILGFITFFMSAVLDNLTATIVMVALLRKLMAEKKDRWFFAGMIIIAANSGGAFSPIGDVTTIMLWIGGQVTALNIIQKSFLPSLISMIIPLSVLSFFLRGEVHRPALHGLSGGINLTTSKERNLVLFMGIGFLLFVPVFKSLTQLPPWVGMMFGLSILWITTEMMHKSRNDEHKSGLTVAGILRRIDTPTILFFLGILTAVAALQSAGHLEAMARSLDRGIGNLYVINGIIGLLSAVIDNVPLVAGAIGMYQTAFPTDHYFWEMLAYCAGTGGSILIIGSAAGVAVMGMEKIDFIWYMKRISLWALTGYLAGAFAYWGMQVFFG
jgi:Na+/H+ antiporter NhaD/arsenite permease-like protein